VTYSRRKHAEIYTALHEGRAPDRFIQEPVPRRPRRVNILGRMTAIQYYKLVVDGEYRYNHPFDENTPLLSEFELNAAPTIGVDERGKLVIFAGRYIVTDRGIEDRKPSQIQSEYLPGKPKYLTDLGTLQFVDYLSESGSKRITFPNHRGPVISHDQNGNLHCLRGQYTIKDIKLGDDSARSQPRRNPRSSEKQRETKIMARHRSRRHRRHSFLSGLRHNPASSKMSGRSVSRALMGTAAVGLTAAATMVALDLGFTRFAPATTDWKRSVGKIAIGVGAAVLLAKFVPPSVAAGIGAGGVIDGSLELYQANLAARVNAAVLPSGRIMSTLPAGYAPYNAASCGVPMAANYR
jgi:hypothetical protein